MSDIRYLWQRCRRVCTSPFSIHLLSSCHLPSSPSEPPFLGGSCNKTVLAEQTCLQHTQDHASPVCDQTYANSGYQKKSRLVGFPLKPCWMVGMQPGRALQSAQRYCSEHRPMARSLIQVSSWEIIFCLHFNSSCHFIGTQNFSFTILQYSIKDCCLHFTLYSLYIITLIVFLQFIMSQSKTPT